jgi:serine/threonine-protein kinase
MPPEQIGKAKTVDHRADIYACTTMIYQSLTGQLPYLAKNVLVMVEMKAKQAPRTLGEALDKPVDPRLESFIAKGLARDAKDRFQTSGEALAAWRDLIQRPSNPRATPIAATPQGWAHASQSAAPLVRPPSPVDISVRNDQQPRASGMYNEATTDDIVATVAMPRARLMPTVANPVSTAPQSYAPNSTVAMSPVGGYPSASSSGTYGAPPQPTHTPVAFAHPSHSQPGYAGPQQQQQQQQQPQGMGGGYGSWPGNVPPNQQQWRQPIPGAEPTPTELPQKRQLPFLFWGILAALIGFAIVGVVLYLTRS